MSAALLGIFTRRPNPKALISLTFNEAAPGAFHIAFSQTLQPDAGGARNFAYESLALPLSDPLGNGQLAYAIPGAFQKGAPPYYFQQAPLAGMGVMTGVFRSQPLVDITAMGSGVVLPLGG